MRTAILEGTPSTSFNQKSKTEPLRPPVPATLPVGHQEMMGRNKTLSNRQVRTTLEVANQIVESMNIIVKRYYFEREEGLKIKKQREHAAIKDVGMSKALKHAEIALKYHLDLQEWWFNFRMARSGCKMQDALDKLRRYSFEALSISNGNEPLWGATLV
ncbi:hypothetical protein FPANT_10690 [Fusarium pseudoanthophilum]|uniref:Uncharacterized protein n=1 Tax=Fusarium pseudoanthophilum TaxID=48495 RepID=A0A8H5NSW4_9HYPO|nr:hypothetical protein FPANT_10690 [Fusarium pseudoanthophilum]